MKMEVADYAPGGGYDDHFDHNGKCTFCFKLNFKISRYRGCCKFMQRSKASLRYLKCGLDDKAQDLQLVTGLVTMHA